MKLIQLSVSDSIGIYMRDPTGFATKLIQRIDQATIVAPVDR